MAMFTNDKNPDDVSVAQPALAAREAKVIQYRPRAVSRLWSPRRGVRPAWRLLATSSVVPMRRSTTSFALPENVASGSAVSRSAPGTIWIKVGNASAATPPNRGGIRPETHYVLEGAAVVMVRPAAGTEPAIVAVQIGGTWEACSFQPSPRTLWRVSNRELTPLDREGIARVEAIVRRISQPHVVRS